MSLLALQAILIYFFQGDIGSFLKRKFDTEGGISKELAIQ